MSTQNPFVKIPVALISNPEVTDGDFRVYAAIRSFGNGKDGSSCFPSEKRIAEKISKHKTTVQRSKRRLKTLNALTWKGGSSGKANQYSFPLEVEMPITGGNSTGYLPAGVPTYLD